MARGYGEGTYGQGKYGGAALGPGQELIIQTLQEANIRGWDYSPKEHDRAVRYRMAVIARANSRERLLNMLKGDPEAAKMLLRNTLARTKSPPAYIEE